MLEKIMQRLEKIQSIRKISFQNDQLREESLPAGEILSSVQKLVNQNNIINIDEDDLGCLIRMNEIKAWIFEFEQPEFDERFLPAFERFSDLDCVIVNVEHYPEFSLESYTQIMDGIETICHKDATIIIGSMIVDDERLRLLILGGKE